MSTRIRRRLTASAVAIATLSLLIGGIVLLSGGSATAKQIATLRILEGTVEVKEGSGPFAPATDGGSLREGDTVRTGPDGRAEIEYFDGSVTRLDVGTTFAITTLETLDQAAGSRVIEAEQTSGNSYSRVTELADAASRFEIETPNATASVQGTIYAIFSQEDGSVWVVVLDGSVAVSGSDGTSVQVGAGLMVTVAPDGSIGDPEPIPDELLNEGWLAFNECVLDEVRECVLGEVVTPEEPEEPEGGQGAQGEDGGVVGEPTTSDEDEPSQDDDGDDPPPPAGNTPPHAGFTATPLLGPAPLTVDIRDASFDPDGDAPLARQWSFGDGTAAQGGLRHVHVYTEPGDYPIALTVRDGNQGVDTKTRIVHVGDPADTTPPVVQITSGPSGTVDSRTATFTFTSSEGGTFVCTLDGDAGSCGGNTGAPGPAEPVSGSVTYTNLADGPHAFAVAVTDPSGNTGSASRSWTVDATPDGGGGDGGGEEPGLDHIVISPATATIAPGASQAYTAEAFDTEGASMGDVSGATAFQVTDGSCAGNVCTASTPGDHTVTGTYQEVSDTAVLTVEEPPPPPATYHLEFVTQPVGGEAGKKFTATPRIELHDQDHAVINNSGCTVVLGLGDNDEGATLTGGSAPSTGSQYTFPHLEVDLPGTYTLIASATGCGLNVAGTTSAPFTVSDPSAGAPASGGVDAAVGLVLPLPLFRPRRR